MTIAMIGLAMYSANGRGPERKPWVARLSGSHPKMGFERSFVEPQNDYRNADKKGRGITVYFRLDRGHIYEVCKWRKRDAEDRYFVRVDANGEPQGMTIHEVRRVLLDAERARDKEIERCLEQIEQSSNAISA